MSKKRALFYAVGVLVVLGACFGAGLAAGSSDSEVAEPEPLPTHTPYPTYTPLPTPKPQIVKETVVVEETVVASDEGKVAEKTYAESVISIFKPAAMAMKAMGNLTNAPRPDDMGWALEVGKHAGTIQMSYLALAALNPPPSMAEAHDKAVDGMNGCYDSMDWFLGGLTTLKGEDIEHASELMEECQTNTMAAMDEMIEILE